MTRRRKFLLAGIVVAAAAWWLGWPPGGGSFHCAARWTEPASTGEVSETVAERLPKDFSAAAQALRSWGFREGDYVVGNSYRRRSIPKPSPVNEAERRAFQYFNRMLDEHDAILVTPFYIAVLWANFCGPALCVHLYMKEDGSTVVRAFFDCPIPRS